jgi:puromycin-sensitive aminopeptidase
MAQTPTGSSDSDPSSPYRLGDDVVPVAYRIEVEPDLDNATFVATTSIDVLVSSPRSTLVVNAAELSVLRADVIVEDGTVLRATTTPIPDEERLELTCDQEVVGPVTLEFTYTGVLNDELRGLYRSTFTDADGVEHTIATTQLCTTDARRAFPGFDEPALKATFELSVIVPPGQLAFSNASVASDVALEGGGRAVTFRPTIKMSSYLVALAVGPFEQTEAVDVDGVSISVVCTPGNAHLGAFALDVAAFALRFYRDYFAIPYPGDKIDLLGIPDFAYGAMENFGCITFRETALLVDEATASVEELQRVALVVAHELAHMWFGDLVTMQWWEGIWLNEAFATHLMYVCVDAYRPTWELWARFGEERDSGFEIDALHSTRPIEFPVSSPAEAMGMLDEITYRKGASVLKMLEQYLGEEVYRDGTRRYLAEHAYANTVTADLWAAFEAVSAEPVGEIMASWILQGGHPVVAVRGGVVSQSPFSFGPSRGPSKIGSGWKVPLRARSLDDGSEVATVLGDEPIDLGLGPRTLVNTGWGFYRSSYDAAGLAAIVDRFGALTGFERGVVLTDAWALARAGSTDVGEVLRLARALGTVPEPSAWRTVATALSLLDRVVGDAHRPRFEATVRNLVGPLLASVGWEAADGEAASTAIVRSLAISTLGVLGADPDVCAESVARFDAGALRGDLADAVIAVVGSLGRNGDRDEMLRRMRGASTPQEAESYRTGIAAIADVELAVATVRDAYELFRLQDVPHVLNGLVANRSAGQAAWIALSEGWSTLVERVPPHRQVAAITSIDTLVSDPEFAGRVEAFLRAHPLEVGHQRVEQALERLGIGVAFADRTGPLLDAILDTP